MDGGLDVTEGVGTEIGDADASSVSYTVGEDALAPVSDGHCAGRMVDGRPEVVVFPFFGLAHVKADPHR